MDDLQESRLSSLTTFGLFKTNYESQISTYLLYFRERSHIDTLLEIRGVIRSTTCVQVQIKHQLQFNFMFNV